MGSILASFRSLTRELERAPGFLLVTVVTLGVALGANAAIRFRKASTSSA